MTWCLDSWAVLRWLEGAEPAASRVEAVLPDQPVMSWINLGEVSYVLQRTAGEPEARQVVRSLRRLLTLDQATPARVLQAAAIKARHRMVYADAFAVATALAHHATLLSGDPELLGPEAGWPVEDLR